MTFKNHDFFFGVSSYVYFVLVTSICIDCNFQVEGGWIGMGPPSWGVEGVSGGEWRRGVEVKRGGRDRMPEKYSYRVDVTSVSE